MFTWNHLPYPTELPPGMQLMMSRYFFPNVSKIGVLYSEKYNKEWLSKFKDSSDSSQITKPVSMLDLVK